MKENHKKALIIAYYLAKYDLVAIKNLNYTSWTEAYECIGKKLNVKKNSVKNWRDEFDPLFPHRTGWNKRLMGLSRREIDDKYKSTDESSLREIVIKLLN